MKNLWPFLIGGASCLLLSCGTKDTTEGTDTDLIDDEVAAEAASVNIEEILDLLSDTNVTSSANSSWQLQSNRNQIEYSIKRTCSKGELATTVTVEKNVTGTISYARAKATMLRTVAGKGTIARKWSKDKQALDCLDTNQAVAFDWSKTGITGLMVTINFERNRTDSITRTLKRNDQELTKHITWSAAGSRDMTWLSHIDNEDGTFSRTIEMSSQVTRERLIANDLLENQISMSLNIASSAEFPLQITTVRNDETFSLVSKTIASGQIESTAASGQKIVTTFDQLQVSFSAASCQMVSGSLQLTFFEVDDTQAAKVLKLEVEDGEFTMTDITDSGSPQTIEDFDYDPCQLANFK